MKRLLVAYEEDLMSLDQLRRRMPELRRREKILTDEIESLDNHLANQETYLKLAENLKSLLARLRDATTNSSIRERQQVLRLVVREILVDSDSVVIRHAIPGLNPMGTPSCHLWGVSHDAHPVKTADSARLLARARGLSALRCYGNSDTSVSWAAEINGTAVGSSPSAIRYQPYPIDIGYATCLILVDS